MVRQATATAVKASISTPVRPVTLTRARTLRPGSSGSGAISTVMFETGRGWHSGINSCVRFAGKHDVQRLCHHHHTAFSDGHAFGRGFFRHVDHTCLAATVEMGELRHARHRSPRGAHAALLAN